MWLNNPSGPKFAAYLCYFSIILIFLLALYSVASVGAASTLLPGRTGTWSGDSRGPTAATAHYSRCSSPGAPGFRSAPLLAPAPAPAIIVREAYDNEILSKDYFSAILPPEAALPVPTAHLKCAKSMLMAKHHCLGV